MGIFHFSHRPNKQASEALASYVCGGVATSDYVVVSNEKVVKVKAEKVSCISHGR